MKRPNESKHPVGLTKPVFSLRAMGLPVARGDEDYVARVIDQPMCQNSYGVLVQYAKTLGVTEGFRKVIDYFKTPAGHTPAGFRIEPTLQPDGLLAIDLVRDIAWDSDGRKHATDVLFSADSANPYEVAPIAGMIANLTCNPGIIYDLFINNPEANVGNKFKTRDEVMAEIGRILGPGCDISVELNNPFADFNEILEEATKFKEMLSEYRVVIKVPHTGPVNAGNVNELLTGSGHINGRFDRASTEDALRGHNVALMLHENGFRVNFTLMFEPYQTQLALQARPYFINSFVRHRLVQSRTMSDLLAAYDATGDEANLVKMRDFMWANDYLSNDEKDIDPKEVVSMARWMVKYRKINEPEGADGLDSMRHNLRVLRNSNLPDTRLIVCSMEGPDMYPDIDKMLTEPEFQDMRDRVVITAEPNYLARFTSTNQVTSYQRRFMKAAAGEK